MGMASRVLDSASLNTIEMVTSAFLLETVYATRSRLKNESEPLAIRARSLVVSSISIVGRLRSEIRKKG